MNGLKKMWYIYAMEYYSDLKKKRTDFGLVRQMNLESVMQSEIRQKEKDRYHILTHIYGI